jgi:glucosylceramidase
MKYKSLLILSILGIFPLAAPAQQVEWLSTTNVSPWLQSNKLQWRESANHPADIIISNEKAQQIKGFGGCFNELAWDALSVLPETERNQILDNIFSPQKANFTINRMPLGANDFSLSFYSYNDTPGDFDMINFNIDRDRYILIPYIRAAKKINPAIAIWASPWCPPAWMKTNNHYASSPDEKYNGLPAEQAVARNSTGFKMLHGYLNAYALYFTKFIKAYEKEGIQIEAVHVQNEPCSNQKFPSCKWRSEDLTYFIGEYLGPKLEAENLQTEIFFGTINTSDPNYFRTALNNEKAMKYIKGLGFQWSGKDAIPIIHKEYPQIHLMQTESECGNGKNEWSYAEYTWSLIHRYLTNGADTYTYWNMILDETGTSPWGWRQNSLVSINKTTKEVVYNPEYFLMRHLSGYVLPGAYRLKTNDKPDHLAFVNPDGKIVLLVVNTEENDRPLTVAYNDKILNIRLKAKSFNTIRFNPQK